MGFTEITTIIFDIGNTLLYPTNLALLCIEIIERNGGHPSADAAMTTFANEASKKYDEFLKKDPLLWVDNNKIRELFIETSSVIIKAALDSQVPSFNLIQKLSDEVYEEATLPERWSLFPDVLPTLRKLTNSGFQLVVVSEWSIFLENILVQKDIRQFFQHVVVSSLVKLSKATPEIFSYALKISNTPANAALSVGDSYFKDIIVPSKIGVEGVLIDRKGQYPEVDCKIAELCELLSIVEFTYTIVPDSKE